MPNAAKPRILRELEGSRVERDTPEPDSGPPERPSWLKGRAASKWDEVLSNTVPGLIQACDGDALARYCSLWQQWRKAIGEGKLDNAIRLDVRVGVLAKELGLTPSARASMHVPGLAKKKSLEAFNRKRA